MSSYVEYFVERYATGELFYRGRKKNKKLHGAYEVWHINGVLHQYSEFRNGLHHGPRSEWDYKGNLTMKMYYLYGNEVSKEEYLKHRFIERLAGVKG